MNETPYKTALIVGAGAGISASLARVFNGKGIRVGLAARNVSKLKELAAETSSALFAADASDSASMHRLFEEVEAKIGAPDIVVYNPSARAHGPIAELDPQAVEKALSITAFGGFLAVHHAAKRMIPKGYGAILLTGASASIKGFPLSAAFAMGKFALRGLAQSAARELGPKGIHVAHFLIDGGVRSERRPDSAPGGDTMLSPEGIADSYWHVVSQPRNAWTFEQDLRPWGETF